MITINLTDEQAGFLAKKMDRLLADAHWTRDVPADDAEHAQTILTKITREITRNRW